MASQPVTVACHARKLRVLYLVEEETIEGLRCLAHVVGAADLRRFDIQVVALSSKADQMSEGLGVDRERDTTTGPAGVTRADNSKHRVDSIWQLVSIVRRGGWDIVHAHSVRTSIVGRLAGQLRVGRNSPIHVHGSLFGERDRDSRHLERIAGTFADAVVSSANAERESSLFPPFAPEEKAPYVSVGIDISRYDGYVAESNLREELGLAPGTLLVGSVSLATNSAEPRTFIEIAKRVLRDHPQAHFLWVGNAASGAEVQVGATACGIENRVHTSMYGPDLRSALSQIDVFLSTATLASFGYVTCEAMALGVPVVATRASGSEKVVAPGMTGYVVPAGEAEVFALAIHLLLNDAALRNRLGRAGRKRAREHFDLASLTKRLERLYVSLLEDRL